MIFEKIKSVIAVQLGINPDTITMESSFVEDLNADSLDVVELIMALEEDYGIEISEEDAEKIVTVGDIVAYVTNHAK